MAGFIAIAQKLANIAIGIALIIKPTIAGVNNPLKPKYLPVGINRKQVRETSK